ncbi:MAG: methyltransferase domain-containing protein [Actinoallomurus sp.]
MADLPPDLDEHSDRLRWNAKYERGAGGAFDVHPLAVRALAVPPPDGPVLDLACGPSGAALAAAADGRAVTAVDVSEVALGLLGEEARRRGVGERITLVQADLARWRPSPGRYALVLCTGFWEREIFGPAATAVMPCGVLAWEAFTAGTRRARPDLPAGWCLGPGEPAALLPPGFTVLAEEDVADGAKRRLLARRKAAT